MSRDPRSNIEASLTRRAALTFLGTIPITSSIAGGQKQSFSERACAYKGPLDLRSKLDATRDCSYVYIDQNDQVYTSYRGESGWSQITTQTAPSTTTIVDDFEDGDITEYGGDLSQFSVTQQYNGITGAPEGTHLLEATSGTNFYGIGSTSGLANYPSADDTFRFYMYHEGLDSGLGSDYVRTNWASQSESAIHDGYKTRLRGDNQWDISKRQGGTISTLASKSVELYDHKWYIIEIDWQLNGSITAELLDAFENKIATITTTDTTYTSGGVGFLLNSSSSSGTTNAYWDNYHIL